MPSPRRVKKSVRRPKNKSPAKNVKNVKKAKSPAKKACKEGKIRSPKTGRCIKDPSLKQHKKMKSPKMGMSDSFMKKLMKSLMFSEEDIENLMHHYAPMKMSEKDGVIIRERLRKFIYDPSYNTPFFNRDPKWSLADATYFQAAARISEYGKGVLKANEI
jgi:hypothetical protein